MSPKKPSHLLGLYIHWPYCLSKCPYCDFASYPCGQIDEDALLRGYQRDLQKFGTDQPITSIFFGGGTPSLMSVSMCQKLLQTIQQYYILSPDIEISMEANPDAITSEKMRAFAALGINRLSIGVQALNANDLAFLGRHHSLERAIECIYEAKTIFQNINMDLIYARPQQSVAAWRKELQQALSFHLPHYSLYQLSIEEGSVFFQKNQRGASETQARRLYLATEDIMSHSPIKPYEVSNYAKKGFECRHNLTYWLGQNYIGIGPAAHGRLDLIATESPRSVQTWLAQGIQTEVLTPKQRHLEKLLLGLRLRKHTMTTQGIDQKNILEACHRKWLIKTPRGIRPTLQGTLMLNQLIQLLAGS